MTSHLRPGLLLRILAPVLAFIALACWAFSSPIGSSPDDDFHLPSIWCGLGERAGLCESSDDPMTRLVPGALVGEPCYSRDDGASAACQDTRDVALVETDRVNTLPLYPPVFYGTMSLFASTDVVTSVLAMRLFNAALFVGMVTAAVISLPSMALRRTALVPVAVTMVPLGMFIVPSTNASSWALLSVATLWVTLYGAAHAAGRRRWVLLGIAVLAAVLGAGARADAGAYAVLSVVTVLILVARRGRRLLDVYGAGALIVVISAAFYLSAAQSAAATEGLPTDGAPLTIWQLIDNFLGVPSLWVGVFGGWGLGWLDTPLPAAVSVLAFAAFAMAAGAGLRVLTARKAVAGALVFTACWLVPFVLLYQSRAIVGTHVQPRYILPLTVLLIGVLVLGTRVGTADRAQRGLVVVASVLLAFANAVALHIELNRYTQGLDERTLVPGKDAQWWWSETFPVWPVWALGLLAFAGALATLYALSVRADRVRPRTA